MTDENTAPAPQSRAGQTFAICATIAAVGLAIIYVLTRADPSDPYAQCQQVIGYDTACRAGVASRRIMSGVTYGAPPAAEYTPPVDREMQQGLRRVIELNEMICKQTGQNCEAAKMARRQYNEDYGEF